MHSAPIKGESVRRDTSCPCGSGFNRPKACTRRRMNRKTLGTGWGFPIRVTPRGGLPYVSGETLIQQSIWIILATAPGERQMLPAFGCGIHRYVFAPNTPANWGDIAHQVRIAL